MYNIQQFRNLLYFIYYNKRPSRFILKSLPKSIRIQFECSSNVRIWQIIIYSPLETLFKQC